MNEILKYRLLVLISTVILIAAVYGLGFTVTQSDFPTLISYYTILFGIYLSICFYVKGKSTVYYFIGLGIVLRFILIFAFPNLSDDIYRFIWDGRLAVNGINPFNHLPSYFIENQIPVLGIGKELFESTLQQSLDEACTGMMFQVLDWNEPAINFYKKYDVAFDGGWINCGLEAGRIREILKKEG